MGIIFNTRVLVLVSLILTGQLLAKPNGESSIDPRLIQQIFSHNSFPEFQFCIRNGDTFPKEPRVPNYILETSEADMVAWHEPCRATKVPDSALLIQISAALSPFICSSQFIAIQDGIQYSSLKIQSTSGGSNFCNTLLVDTTFRLTTTTSSRNFDKNSPFTLIFNSSPEPIRVDIPAYALLDNSSRLQNLSTRGFVGTGDNVLIGGLIIKGTESKLVIVRGRGPDLAEAGIEGSLMDPVLTIFSGSNVIDQNDNWREHKNVNLVPEELKPSNSESVIVTSLPPGAYTAILEGKDKSEGIGLIEVFEMENTFDTRLLNVATRGFVGEGDNVLIAGFIVTGELERSVVVRARGPSLEEAGISGFVGDPKLTIFSGPTVIDENDNWEDHEFVEHISNEIKPSNSLDAAVYMDLVPGAYTAIVSGVNGETGIGIVEVFQVD